MSERFTLFDSGGEQHTAVRSHSRINTSSISDLRRTSIEGLASVRLENGQQLTPVSGGLYRIVQTGELLYPRNPLLDPPGE